MEQPIFGLALFTGNPRTVYYNLNGINAVAEFNASLTGNLTTGDFAPTVIPVSGKLKQLKLETHSGGIGGTAVFTVRKNGVDTALAVTWNSGTSASNIVDEIDVVAGDLLTIRIDTVGFGGQQLISYHLILETVGNKSLIGSYTNTNPSAAKYLLINDQAFGNNNSAIEADMQFRMPTNGTLRNFYFYIGAAPGAGNSFTATVYKNGSPTSLTAILSGAGTQQLASVSADIPLAEGDTISLKITPAGIFGGSYYLTAWGLEFDPEISGESIYGSKFSAVFDTNFDWYSSFYGGSRWQTATFYNSESFDTLIPAGFTIKKFNVQLSGAPGVGTSVKISVGFGSPSYPEVTISDLETSGEDLVEYDVLADSQASFIINPDNFPNNNVETAFSMVFYKTPETTNQRADMMVGFP